MTQHQPSEATAEPNWKAELEAMQAICKALEPLSKDAQARVLACVLCLLDDGVAAAAIRRWKSVT